MAGGGGERAAGLCDASPGWATQLDRLIVIGVGLTWALFQHMLSGLRHLVMDTGAGFELRTNKIWAMMTLVGSILAAPSLFWVYLLGG